MPQDIKEYTSRSNASCQQLFQRDHRHQNPVASNLTPESGICALSRYLSTVWSPDKLHDFLCRVCYAKDAIDVERAKQKSINVQRESKAQREQSETKTILELELIPLQPNGDFEQSCCEVVIKKEPVDAPEMTISERVVDLSTIGCINAAARQQNYGNDLTSLKVEDVEYVSSDDLDSVVASVYERKVRTGHPQNREKSNQFKQKAEEPKGAYLLSAFLRDEPPIRYPFVHEVRSEIITKFLIDTMRTFANEI